MPILIIRLYVELKLINKLAFLFQVMPVKIIDWLSQTLIITYRHGW